uniref:Pentatricopeptide repeat-containing protein n=1 Tax=Solanum tuberosum TaxID=4113 RepID=M1D004_SOLTU
MFYTPFLLSHNSPRSKSIYVPVENTIPDIYTVFLGNRPCVVPDMQKVKCKF